MTGYILHRAADEDLVCGARYCWVTAWRYKLAGGLATVRLSTEDGGQQAEKLTCGPVK
jgi:hypothetical protein